MDSVSISKPLATDADPVCDGCGILVDLTRAQARVIRSVFGVVNCSSCDEYFDFEDAWDEIVTEIGNTVEEING